jgi:hypothetical protein
MPEEKQIKQRTLLQNRSLHLTFSELAKILNEYGLNCDDKIINIDVPWSGENVKNIIWRPVQQALLGKSSTTELSTTDIDKVFDIIVKAVAEKTGEVLEWPSIQSIMDKQIWHE